MHKALTIPIILIVDMLVAGVTVSAQVSVRDHELEPEDYFTIGTITNCVTSPDGKFVAYTEMRWEPPAEKRNTDIWVVETSIKRVQRLTFDTANDSSPQWSPDGRYIYFTSNRKRGDEDKPPYNGKKQVWRIPRDGGELLAVTRVEDGVGAFELSKDGQALYYTVSNEVVDDAWKDLREKYKDLKYGKGITEFTQVWKLDLVNWRSKKIIDENRVIVDFEVSPDQRRIAMITRPDETLLTNEGWSRVDVYDARSKQVAAVTEDGWRKAHPSPYGWLDSVSWAADSAALAFTVSFDGYPPQVYVAEWSGDTSSIRELDRPDGSTVTGGTVDWRGRSRDLCFLADDRARSRVYCITDVRDGRQGPARSLTPDDVVVRSYSFSERGEVLAAVLGTIRHTPDIFLVSDAGAYDRLTNVNPQVDSWKLPQISIVSWKGANGDTVEGILELPPDYERGTPLPMIVEIHGGPTSASNFSLRFWIYGRALMPAKGYALLSPNYRGSTGYGDKFLVELVGHENDIEVEDILKGVDAMVERGIADPDRLGVMGWSNGGFLTNCLITTTDRFKAASSGAGVLHQDIQWGIEDTPGHVINYMQSLPWEDPAAYRKGSPYYNLDKVKTPTLIHVGENDARVPSAHSRTLFRALHRYLQIPTELVIYPGEGHGLTTYEHRKAKMEWDIAWFGRYIRGETKAPSAPETKTN